MTTEQEPEETRIAKVERGLIDLLSEKGNNYDTTAWPVYFKPEWSGTGDLFLVEWGPKHTKRVVKLNKPSYLLKTPRQRRHVLERGCDTFRELDIVSGIDHPGVVKLLDYYDIETAEQYKLNGPVIVQEYFPDSESLEEIVSKRQDVSGGRKKLSKQTIYDIALQAGRIIRDTINGVGVEGKIGIYHRDLKPSNILVQIKDGKPVVKIADWANASKVDSQKPGYLPTMGGHIVSDPLLMGVFTGEERAYNYGSEIYALFSDILFLRRGKPFVSYDPDSREARAIDSWEDLCDENGRVDKEKHQRVVREALKVFPRALRKIGERALTLYENQRYRSFNQFYSDLEKAIHGSSRLKKWGLAAAVGGALGLAAILGTGWYNSHKDQTWLQKQSQSSGEYHRRNHRLNLIYMYQQSQGNISLDNLTPVNNLEISKLEGWLHVLYPYDHGKKAYYGDKLTAFAAYLDSFDPKFEYPQYEKPPYSVFEAIMRVNGITDPRVLEERLEKKDPSLVLDYKKLEPIIEKIDRDLYYNMFGIIHNTHDNWEFLARRENMDKSEKLWKMAGEWYSVKQTSPYEAQRLREQEYQRAVQEDQKHRQEIRRMLDH